MRKREPAPKLIVKVKYVPTNDGPERLRRIYELLLRASEGGETQKNKKLPKEKNSG